MILFSAFLSLFCFYCLLLLLFKLFKNDTTYSCAIKIVIGHIYIYMVNVNICRSISQLLC